MAPGTATVATGVPLRVALERRVPVRHVGSPLQGRLVEPIYVYDRMVIPAGSVVEGHIAEIGGIPVKRRIMALFQGNFTPPREARVQFDTLTTADGLRVAVSTDAAHGAAYTAWAGKKNKPPLDVLALRTPGKMSRIENYLLGMLPYHRQSWSAGTLFSAALASPLTVPAGLFHPTESESRELRVRLVTPLSSSNAKRGDAVEAVVMRPQFSADHTLLIPEGAKLIGEVVTARRARYLHRSGKLQFAFRQVSIPEAAPRPVQGFLEGVEANWAAHLELDAEGAVHAANSPTRFIFPAIASAVAAASFHQDFNAQGVPDQDIGGRAESGAVGLGLVGTLLTQAGPRALASGVAIAGAAFSIYTNVIARGEDVVLPLNTPLTVSLGTTH